MTLKQIFKLAIDLGIKNDFRSPQEVKNYLARNKKQYQKLSSQEKKFFNLEKLSNPYLDSDIHYDNGRKIKKILSGIDIDAGELLIAQKLGADGAIAHHPLGKGLSHLPEVMKMQADILAHYGIPINVAESLINIRKSEVFRSVNPANHFKTPMAAKNLDMNLANVHTPADNLVANFLRRLMKRKKPQYVEEILEILLEIPEYQEAKKQGVGPTLFAGKGENRTGRIAISEITGGTEGSAKIYQAMAQAGIGTILSMHQSEEHRKEAEKAHINVVIAGHMSSDSLGMNLFLDQLEKRGIKIIPAGGLIRVSRIKNPQGELT